MKGYFLISLRVGVASIIGAAAVASAIPNSLTPAQDQREPQSDVIVILRDQLPGTPPARRAMGARASAVAAAQTPVVAQLQQNRTRKVTSFNTINAFATTVSAAEAAQLATHPMVQAVVPDRTIHAQRHGQSAKAAGVSGRVGGAA